MGTGNINAGGNPAMDFHPIQGGEEIILVILSVLKVAVASSCSYKLFFSFSTLYPKFSFTTGREISSKSKNIRLPFELCMWAYLTNLWRSRVEMLMLMSAELLKFPQNVRRLNIVFASLIAAICDGHNFPAQYVIHVHSPTWGNDSSVDNLEKAVKNVLTLADEKNIKTIALPSIGSGS